MRAKLRFVDEFVDLLTASDVADQILSAIATQNSLQIGNLNLHGLYQSMTHEPFRSYTQSSDIVLADGMPILLLAKASRKRSGMRVGSTDWLDELLVRDPEIRILAFGGSPTSSSLAAAKIQSTQKNIKWLSHDGHSFKDEANFDLLRNKIIEADLILVGLGMPLQETWISENTELFKGKVVANVGGCIDYYSGEQRLTPRWIGAIGFEWLYRLIRSPRRLLGRYLVEPWCLAYVVAKRNIAKR